MRGRLNISQVVFWQRSRGKRTHAGLHKMKASAGCARNDNGPTLWRAEVEAGPCLNTRTAGLKQNNMTLLV